LLSCVDLAVAIWGVMRAGDGQMALPRPIRAEFVRARRETMAVFIAIALILGFQAVLVANTPESGPVLSVASLTGNVSQIVVLALLLTVMLRRLDAWARHEGIMAGQPLVPDDGERLTEAARMGRPLIHDINNKLGHAVGTLDLLSVDPDLTEAQHVELERVAESLGQATTQLRALQRLVRGLGVPSEQATEV
jgi:hypothetical protein